MRHRHIVIAVIYCYITTEFMQNMTSGLSACGGVMLSPGQTIATCQRNMSQHCWAQHVACVWPPCCNMLAVVGSSLKLVKFEPTTANMSQHVATRWPNECNMLRPTMLRHVASCCVGMLRSFGWGLTTV